MDPHRDPPCARGLAVHEADTELVVPDLRFGWPLGTFRPLEAGRGRDVQRATCTMSTKDALLRVDVHPAADIDDILLHRWMTPIRVERRHPAAPSIRPRRSASSSTSPPIQCLRRIRGIPSSISPG